jgi:hypothetical protein
MLKKIAIGLALIIIVLGGLSFTPQFAHLKNFASWGVHTIHDYKTHPTRLVPSGGKPQYWPLHSSYNKMAISDSLLAIMDSNDTHAFLVIQDGKLIYKTISIRRIL